MKSYVDQCQIARRCQETFHETLLKLRLQYENLWRENLELIKCIEETTKIIPSNTNHDLHKEIDKPIQYTAFPDNIKKGVPDIKESLLHPKSNVLGENCNVPDIIIDFNSDSEPTLNKKETQTNQLITSPIVNSKHRRRRRKKGGSEKSLLDSDFDDSIELNSKRDFPDTQLEEAMCRVSFENEMIIEMKSDPDSLSANKSLNQAIINESDVISDDDGKKIQIIEKSKLCQELIINKSCTGDVEISQDGRKLIQSKLKLQKVVKKPETIFSLDNEKFSTNWDVPKINDPHAIETIKNISPKLASDDESIVYTPMRSIKSKNRLSLSLAKSKKDLFGVQNKKSTNETQDKCAGKASHLDSKENTYFVVPSQSPGYSKPSAKRKLSLKHDALDDTSFLNDETFFSPEEGFKLKQSRVDEEDEVVQNLDPENETENTQTLSQKKELPFVEKAVRGKSARAQLEGWDCWECEKFYEGMGYTEEEIKKMRKNCSRHRSKFNPRLNTPAGFWNPVFTNNSLTQLDD